MKNTEKRLRKFAYNKKSVKKFDEKGILWYDFKGNGMKRRSPAETASKLDAPYQYKFFSEFGRIFVPRAGENSLKSPKCGSNYINILGDIKYLSSSSLLLV